MMRIFRKEFYKFPLFPGINLHARLRFHQLPRFFRQSKGTDCLQVLDAGCGNGMLSYRCYQKGNHVLGISVKKSEVEGCQRLFNDYLGIPTQALQFRLWNLYEVEKLGMQFDEIICSEVLEHLRRDADVCRSFWKVLRPGGVLHLCCPNADHPDNASKSLDNEERGGHVRSGYTMEAYKNLLEPIGFQVVDSMNLGGTVRQAFNRQMIRLQEQGWRLTAFGLFCVSSLFVWADPRVPRVPYSIYVRLFKPADFGQP